MTKNSLPPEVRCAVEAVQDKKAAAITALDLAGLDAFMESFLLCTGSSHRQVQAISDEVEERLAQRGMRLLHREGYETAEWILLDYGSFVVHIFTERTRQYYDLERLWRSARRVDLPDEMVEPDARSDTATGTDRP